MKILDKVKQVEFMGAYGAARPTIGSFRYSNFPKEGIYRVTEVCSVPSAPQEMSEKVEVYGVLVIPTAFGYPDEGYRGRIIENILNGHSTFERGPSGCWQVTGA